MATSGNLLFKGLFKKCVQMYTFYCENLIFLKDAELTDLQTEFLCPQNSCSAGNSRGRLPNNAMPICCNLTWRACLKRPENSLFSVLIQALGILGKGRYLHIIIFIHFMTFLSEEKCSGDFSPERINSAEVYFAIL